MFDDTSRSDRYTAKFMDVLSSHLSELLESAPHPEVAVARAWDQVVDEWADSKLPIPVRGTGWPRGTLRTVETRKVLSVDNAAAHWIFTLALKAETRTFEQIQQGWDTRSLGLTGMLTQDESANAKEKGYKTEGPRDNSVTAAGWKVCHIDPVGLGANKKKLTDAVCVDAFRKLMKPSNMFLVPKQIGGMGEIPYVLEYFRTRRAASLHG